MQANELLQEESQPSSSSSHNNSIIQELASPRHIRKGSSAYYKAKYQNLRQKVNEFIEETNEVDLDGITGFYEKNKVKSSKNKEKSVCITQLTGSMSAKKACEAVKKLREKKLREKIRR